MNTNDTMTEPVTGSYDVSGSIGGRKTFALKIYKGSLIFQAFYHYDSPRLDPENSTTNNQDTFKGKLTYNCLDELLSATYARAMSKKIELHNSEKLVGTITEIDHTFKNELFNENAAWFGSTYPIDKTKATTTAHQTIIPKEDLSNDETIILANKSTWKNEKIGFEIGTGLRYETRTDICSNSATKSSKKLLNFFTISDIHITDKETPNQLLYLQQIPDEFHKSNTSVYSPVMPYTCHVLDATIQTINALHANKTIEFDLGISLGDASNNTQLNETNWYLQIMEGGLIHPASGDSKQSTNIDYQKPFYSNGLNKKIPWYQVVGNHDLFFIGSIPVDNGPRKYLRDSFVSDTIIQMGDVLPYMNDLRIPLNEKIYSMGVIDGTTDEGKIIKQGTFQTRNKVAPDKDRKSLRALEWIEKFKNHGFRNIDPTQSSNKNDRKTFGCYSFSPKSTSNIKIICLDDIQREDDGDPGIHGHGYLDAERWKWLKQELESGQKNNQLMIIAAHIPIGVELTKKTDDIKDISPVGWADYLAIKNTQPNAEVPTEQQLLDKLHATPNVLMWIAGHRHYNTVSLFKSPDGNNDKSFWQIETSSLRDFPQQFRTFEISISEDVIAVKTTNIDYASPQSPNAPTTKARKFAVAAQQIVNNTSIYQTSVPETPNRYIHPMGKSASYNAILLKKINKDLAAKLNAK